RTHRCDTCGNLFMRSQDLERHMATHLAWDEYPFACGCGRKFKRKDAISRHVRVGGC
ncbi:hypothetical protein BC829DRAFT_345660, partial [Chytridium lagenaria]